MKSVIKFIKVSLSLFLTFNAISQTKEADKWLVDDPAWYASVKGESNGDKVLIDITCSAESITDIKKEAIKSALFILIFQGFEPGQNGEPSVAKLSEEIGLYESKKMEFDSYFTDPIQGPIQAQAKLNPSKPGSEFKVEKQKLLKATFTVEVNLENLRKDLEGRKLIKVANQSTSGYKPNIIILPSDAWMKNKDHNFHSTKNNQGIVIDIYDYKNALDHPEMQKVLTEMKSKFEQNFKIVNYKEKSAEILKEEAKNNALPVSKQQSPLDIYAKVLAADLWVKIDVSTTKISGGQVNQKFISIEAYNPFTGNSAFTGRQIEKQTSGDNDWEVTKNSIREACNEIKPRFTDFFSKRELEGIEGRITCSISESAGELNFSTEVPFKSQQISIQKIIESSIGKMTVKTKDNVGRMNPDGDQTSTLLRYKDVFIQVSIEEEEIDLDAEEGAPAKKVLAANNFGKVAAKLKSDLEKKFGITSEFYTKGLGNVEIVITGKK
jgi:hypothetical protein